MATALRIAVDALLRPLGRDSAATDYATSTFSAAAIPSFIGYFWVELLVPRILLDFFLRPTKIYGHGYIRLFLRSLPWHNSFSS